MASIYVIRNTENTRVYVGATTNPITQRFIEHKSNARNLRSTDLCWALRTLGEDKFYIEHLELCEETIIRQREAYWIDKLGAISEGYNEKSMDTIMVYDLQGVFISEFNSILSLARHYKLNTREIHGNLEGEQYRVGELTFFRKTEFTTELLKERIQNIRGSRHYNRGRFFTAYKEGIAKGIYSNKTNCAEELNLTRQKIGQCLQGNIKKHKGYTFEYND